MLSGDKHKIIGNATHALEILYIHVLILFVELIITQLMFQLEIHVMFIYTFMWLIVLWIKKKRNKTKQTKHKIEYRDKCKTYMVYHS